MVFIFKFSVSVMQSCAALVNKTSGATAGAIAISKCTGASASAIYAILSLQYLYQ